ncbi:BON domain-containing protein [Paraburkholderia sp. CNPSo 3272]|uniref:BON domain-containing protein n=1 Tax=Paraburkholderia sp. CNPSo 3272 TaxID=2940931 RepID=UPI0020B89005|nr:BON domain-containing protein [Paraburkholderia sp. CNPSo 3272]MCP3727506.1 BON domain-containing protein [Paraburkholderia sp. CNPSo 3272]
MNTVIRIQRILAVAMFVTLTGNVAAQTRDAAVGSAPAATSAMTGRSTKPLDRKLAHRVANVLARTRGLNSAHILVHARDGQITLSGSVTDSAQIPLALDAAKQVDGVGNVENRIRVAGASL